MPIALLAWEPGQPEAEVTSVGWALRGAGGGAGLSSSPQHVHTPWL